MPGKRRAPLALALSLIVVGTLAAFALILWAVSTFHIDFGVASAQGTTLPSIAVLLLGAAISVLVYGTMVAIGLADRRRGERISPLYEPMLFVRGALMCYMAYLTAQLLDFAAHGLTPHWTPLYQPGVRLAANFTLLMVFVGFGWQTTVLLRGRGWSRGRVSMTFAAALGGMALLVVAFVLLIH